MNDTQQLSKTTVVLHWLIALAMIGSVIFGLYLEDLPRSPEKGALIGIHKSVGMLILLAAALRIVWRSYKGFPGPMSEPTLMQRRVAGAVHFVLLAATIYMPLSGVMMSVGGGHPVGIFGLELIAGGPENELLGDIGHLIHGFGKNLLILAVLLHVAGALKRSLLDRDGTMQRMLGQRVGA